VVAAAPEQHCAAVFEAVTAAPLQACVAAVFAEAPAAPVF
jgi:hypothetical protein